MRHSSLNFSVQCGASQYDVYLSPTNERWTACSPSTCQSPRQLPATYENPKGCLNQQRKGVLHAVAGSQVPWIFLEYPKLRAVTTGEITISAPVLLSNAMAAFALNLAVYLLIGKTSALTMNIAGELFCEALSCWRLVAASCSRFVGS